MRLITQTVFCFLLFFISYCRADSHIHIYGVDLKTGQIEECQPEVEYELYIAGENQVEDHSLFLIEEDFRIGRVKTLLLSDQSPISIHFHYETDATKVAIREGKAILYRYTDQLHSIEYYQNDETNSSALYRKERFFWSDSHLVNHVTENGLGDILLCRSFRYNEEGMLTGETVAGNLSGTCSVPCTIDEQGNPEANGIEFYRTNYEYSPEDSSVLLSQTEETGMITSYEYDSSFEECVVSRDFPSDAPCFESTFDDFNDSFFGGWLWQTFVDKCYAAFQHLQLSAEKVKSRWNTELNITVPLQQAIEKISKNLFGSATYLLMGPHFDLETTEVHCYGKEEINEKVRVTFINGILNTRDMMNRSLKFLSESHGDVKIHYVFRPTEGWTWDISRAFMIKTTFNFGFRSCHAYLLAEMWQELIQEMGGVGQGGTIIHYAHSLGGTETDRARELLSLEEQKMIRVVTFGSATLIRNEGFQSVVNHASVNDGVCSCFVEPLGHIRNFFDPHTNVIFYGASLKYIWPIDHTLIGMTYERIIRQLGEEFVTTFKPNLGFQE